MISAAMERLMDKLDVDEDGSSEGIYTRLVELRGGCHCFIWPPCSACSYPMTEDEATQLGLLEDE